VGPGDGCVSGEAGVSRASLRQGRLRREIGTAATTDRLTGCCGGTRLLRCHTDAMAPPAPGQTAHTATSPPHAMPKGHP
jgi:hypothetical protein